MALILLVDDEPNMRLMVKLTLQHMGHTVEMAGSGAEGLGRFVSGKDWKLVLLDHRLQDTDGIEVLRAMRKHNQDCPVVVISAFGTGDLPQNYTKAGAVAFLPKPFTAEQLREAVEAAL